MTLRRFVVPPEAVRGGSVVLRGPEARHAAVVLRMQPGERVVVIDGSGLERIVELTTVSPDEATGRVLETRQGTGSPVRVILVQAVPKGAKMDEVVRMGTELGVEEFVPVLSARSVAEGRGRVERWRRIGAAAAKQSRRSDIPAVRDPRPLAEALDGLPPETLLLALWEGEPDRTLGAALRGRPRPTHIALVVGPEGGLDEDDIRVVLQHGGLPVTIGPHVLRTETAGMAAIAMILYEFELRE
jgi:16S rRNA (uracil1498-N3)-methyltransferase